LAFHHGQDGEQQRVGGQGADAGVGGAGVEEIRLLAVGVQLGDLGGPLRRAFQKASISSSSKSTRVP
jgi:hypothetical protein